MNQLNRWNEFEKKHKISERYKPNEQIIFMAFEEGIKEGIEQTVEKIKDKLPKEGTIHSGYWLWRGKRVIYKQLIHASQLLNVLASLASQKPI